LSCPLAQDQAQLLEMIRDKAANLFESGELLCAPAVLVTLNSTFNGGLADKQARALAAALPEGMGGAGCTCGALSGAQMALGLFMGDNTPWRKMAPPAQEMHDLFKDRFGSTCCRVISKKVKHDPKAHKAFCVELTGQAASMSAGIILAAKPDLAQSVGLDCLCKRTSRLAAGVKKLLRVG
jgi:C_GCAxxG_C_C family probable redox protein